MKRVVDVLFQTEVLKGAETLFFSSPDAVDNILDGDCVVCLAVSSVSERHAWRIHLRNWCQCEMRWPVLD